MVSVLSDSEIEAVLASATYAHLGCHAKGKTYVVPINFAYDGKRIIGYTGEGQNDDRTQIIGYTSEGQKMAMMRENPEVCVQIEEVKSLAEWKSVIVWGRFEELSGSDSTVAREEIFDRYGPIFDAIKTPNHRGRNITPPRRDGGFGHMIVYCIHVDEKTGRFERP